MIMSILFDFGGVLAEEGFRKGLRAIAMKNHLNPDNFFTAATDLIYQTGYITGVTDEYNYWKTLREKTGIVGSDEELREEILSRFIIRPVMLEHVERLKFRGFTVAILSDQTNWLEEINAKNSFYHYFDYVFNSFRLRKSKRDPSVFSDVCSIMGRKTEEALFVDDTADNIKRASEEGLATIHFKDMSDFESQILELYMH